MARVANDGFGTGGGSPVQHIDASGQSHIQLPNAEFIRDSELTRDGQDLIIHGQNGETIVVDGYFGASPMPMLTAEGLTLSPEMVHSFAHHEGNIELADNHAGAMNDESGVGVIKEVTGNATIVHPDGSKEPATVGMAIHEGDVVETTAGGAVNIVFIDQSTFAVSENARIAIDEYVFDPSSESGSTNVSVLRGMFVYTSGLIGREDPDDVTIHTPQGSIGIRGTIIAGDANSGKVSVLEGAIVLKDFNGNEMTLDSQFETAQFSSDGHGITSMGTSTPAEFAATFSGMRSVAPDLFTGVGAPDGSNNAPANNGAQTPATQTAPENHGDNTPAAADAPAQQADATPAAPALTVMDTSFGTTDAPAANFDSTAGLTASNTGGSFDSAASAPATSVSAPATAASASVAAPANTTTTSAAATTAPAATDTTQQPPPSVTGNTTSGGTTVTTGNHAPVILANQTFSFTENSTAGVANVIATDADAGQTLSYALTGSALFAIDANTGAITLTAAPDREAQASYTVTVTATDNDATAPRSTSATITINIADVNDNTPSLAGGTYSINENSTTGTTVGYVAGTDLDSSSTLTYTITGGTGVTNFAINSSTGEITVLGGASLDFETTASYTLTVTASDGTNTSTAANITININDVNDAVPQLDLDANNSSGATGSNFTTSYTENSASALLTDSDLNLSDADSANMQSATVTITNIQNPGLETLTAVTTGTNITASYNPTTGVLSLSGNDTLAHYNAVLQSITYDNSSDTPGTTARIIQFQVSDGVNTSATATTTVALTAVNDTPAAQDDDISGTQAATVNGNVFSNNGNGADADPEGDTLAVSEVNGVGAKVGTAVVGTGGSHGGGLFTINADGTFTFDANHDFDFLGNGQTATTTATYTVSDGNGGTDTATVTVTVTGDTSGNNTFVVRTGDGSQTQDGGGGSDVYDASGIATAMFFTMGAGTPDHVQADNSADSDILTGIEKLIGGSGNDSFSILDGTYAFTLDGGGGSDSISYATVGATTLAGGIIADLATGNVTINNTGTVQHIANFEKFTGSLGNDTITGGGGDEILLGMDGNDTFIGSAGNDQINGGNGGSALGTDTIDYSVATGAVTVDLSLTSAQTIGGGMGNDTLLNIQNVLGSNYNDTIRHAAGIVNVLHGGAGDDALYGGEGDTLYGEANDDKLSVSVTNSSSGITLDGGTGIDTLVFTDSGTYNTSAFGSVNSIEKISTAGVAVTLNLQLNGSWFANNSGDLTVTLDSDDILNLDFSTYSSVTFSLQSDNGSQAVFLGSNGKLLTINHTTGDQIHWPGQTINLNGINGVPGFSITNTGAKSIGMGVASADINGDGLNDLLFSTDTQSGEFGRVLGGSTGASYISLPGNPAGDKSSSGITAIGDFNGDGMTDFVLSMPYADGAGAGSSGGVFIMDKTGTITTTLIGFASGSSAGQSVISVGDINHDGYADFAFGAPGANGTNGSAHLIYGSANPATNINVGSMTSAEGVSLNGTTNLDMVGANMAGIGDFNQDGYNDFAVSIPGQSSVKIILGGAGLADGIQTGDMISINGVSTGGSTTIPLMSGDFNGDGVNDLAIFNKGGHGSLTVFDGSGAYTGGNTISNTAADVTIGLNGHDASTINMISAGSVGDFNGDGVDDMVLVLQDGTSNTHVDMYVLYGGNFSAFNGDVTLNGLKATLDSGQYSQHMNYDMPAGSAASSFQFVINGAGDMNGDGYEDIFIGTPNMDNNPSFDSDGNAVATDDSDGSFYIVYGHSNNGLDILGTTGTDTLNAAANNQMLNGMGGNDTLKGANFATLTMLGGAGNDVLEVGNGAFQKLDGGTGTDSLNFTANGSTLDLSGIANGRLEHLEAINLTGNNQTLTLTLSDIFSLFDSSDTHRLTIHANDPSTATININDEGGGAATLASITQLQTLLHATSMTSTASTYELHFGGSTTGAVLEIDKALVDAPGHVNVT